MPALRATPFFCFILACLTAGNTVLFAAGDKPAPPVSPAEPSKVVKPAVVTEESKPEIVPAGANDVPADAPKYQLAYKFKPGAVVRYEVSYEGEINIQFNEATQLDHNKSETRKSYRVVSVNPDGSGNLELMIDWVHMTAKIGNKPPEVFKSDDPEFQSAKYSSILETVGKPQAVITFKTNGVVTKVQASPGATANKPAVAGASTDETSPESYLAVLPDQPVAVGDTWKERFDIKVQGPDNLPLKVAVLRGYRLMGVEGHLATIAFKTSILTPIHDPAVSAQLIQREFSGTTVFDLEQGLAVSHDRDVDRTVINPFGGKSSMRAVSKFRERLLTGPVTAQKPGTR